MIKMYDYNYRKRVSSLTFLLRRITFSFYVKWFMCEWLKSKRSDAILFCNNGVELIGHQNHWVFCFQDERKVSLQHTFHQLSIHHIIHPPQTIARKRLTEDKWGKYFMKMSQTVSSYLRTHHKVMMHHNAAESMMHRKKH